MSPISVQILLNVAKLSTPMPLLEKSCLAELLPFQMQTHQTYFFKSLSLGIVCLFCSNGEHKSGLHDVSFRSFFDYTVSTLKNICSSYKLEHVYLIGPSKEKIKPLSIYVLCPLLDFFQQFFHVLLDHSSSFNMTIKHIHNTFPFPPYLKNKKSFNT